MLYSSESSYYTLFLQGVLYNKVCYECVYASSKRIGDITIGDFWGIKEEIPSFFTENSLKDSESVSAVLVNTKKGLDLLTDIEDEIVLKHVEYNQILKHNPQLNSPAVCDWRKREKIEAIYKENGYEGIENYFKNNTGKDKYLMRLSTYIPMFVKKWIKWVLSKKRRIV